MKSLSDFAQSSRDSVGKFKSPSRRGRYNFANWPFINGSLQQDSGMQNTNAIAWVIFVGFAVFGVVIVLVLFGKKQARERALAMQAAAQQIGFTFLGNDQTRAVSVRTTLFRRGGGRRFRNIMNGSHAGFEISLFDYSYTISTGKSSSTFTQTVAAFIQNLPLPVFDLHREGFFDRVGDVFTHNDIDFESNPEFSRRYHLSGDEKERIQELFTPALLTFLEGLSPDSGWHFEGSGLTLILYRGNQTIVADQLQPFLDETSSLAHNFFTACGLKAGK